MWYFFSTIAGGLMVAVGVLLVLAGENWSEGKTWRGQTRHEGRQS